MFIGEARRHARTAVLVMMSWLGAWSALAGADSVAMITDTTGGVTQPAGGAKGNITILTEIEADTRLQLAPAARLVVFYLGSGDEYTMRGPALVEFKATEPVAVSGAQPVRSASPLAARGAGVRIKPVGVAQAAFVMRGVRPGARIQMLNLSGTKTLEARPEFRWQALQPGLEYRIEISDETGRSLQEAQVSGTSFTLAPNVTLLAGVSYTWEVSARLPDGRKYSSAGDFSVAGPDLRAQAEGLRPAEAAPVSARVVYAAWLDQMELKDEARKYWRALSAERPEDAKLKSLAGE